jgi:uncharacterized membrane protein YozB (DUF420 family)
VRSGTLAKPRNDHAFFGTMAVLIAIVLLWAFGSTYLPKIFGEGSGFPAIVHVHAALQTGWLVLFVTQTTLVRRGRTDLHRRLGAAGAVFALLLLLVGIWTSIAVARLGHRGLPGLEKADAAGFLLLNLSSITVFALLVGIAWSFRRSPQAHKRLMLLATVSLMPPGVARLPLLGGNLAAIGLVVLSFLLAGPAWDLVSRGRIHKAYIGGVLLMLAPAPPLLEALSATGTWQAIAAWMVGPAS